MDRVQEKLGKYPCLVWVIALIPVLFGGLVYLLYRPKNIILFEVLNKLGGSTTVDIVRSKVEHVHLPDFVVYSLPAGLWTASYLMTMCLCTKQLNKKMRLSLALPLPISAVVLEFMQLFGLCPGTFDIYDVVCYVIPIIIFVKLV
ncbi:hypothetical protein V7U47_13690 [Segatella copri]|uniref:hypothetical protein n=1 Tax=Segatella copri TaxID=165179 RepID=UPI002FF049DF